MDSAASSRFCEAAEQSRNQALEDLIVSPQTTIACLVSFSIRAKGKAFGHRIQGFPVGYDNEFPRSPVTGGRGGHSGSYQFVYLFLFYRAILILTYAFAIEYRFQGLVFRFLPLVPRRGAGHEENGDQEEKTDSHKDGFIWFITDYLLNINVEGIFCKASFRCSETSFHVL